MVLDEVVPHPQYRMCHSRIVRAPPPEVRDQLYRVTMAALPLGYALEAVRLMPARLAGRRHHPLAGRTILDVTPIPVLFSDADRGSSSPQASARRGGFSEGRSVRISTQRPLRAWSQPGWIKVAMEFRLECTPAGTRLDTETRILATDWRRRAWARPRPLSWYMVLSKHAPQFPKPETVNSQLGLGKVLWATPSAPCTPFGGRAHRRFPNVGRRQFPTVHSGRITCAGDYRGGGLTMDTVRCSPQSFESGAHLSSECATLELSYRSPQAMNVNIFPKG